MKNNKNILIVAAHPDDEVLGIGGTILKHIREGSEVYVAMATDGQSGVTDNSVVEQVGNAMKQCGETLGIKNIFELGFQNQMLDTLPLIKIAQSIEKVIKEINPEIVYIHHEGDVNQDHRELHNACMIAVRTYANHNIREVRSYETLSSTHSHPTMPTFEPNLFVDIKEFLEQKIKAFSAYETECLEFPHPRSVEGIRTLAKFRGMQSGMECVEAFKVLWRKD